MKPGRPLRKDVEPVIREILNEQGHVTPTEIKRRFIKKTNTVIGYHTIVLALGRLIKAGIVEEIISNKSEKRITAIYCLTHGRRRK